MENVPIYVIQEDYKLPKIKEWLSKETVYGVDIETNSLNEFTGDIRTIQIATKDRVCILDLKHLTKKSVGFTLLDFFRNPDIVKVIHNAYFEVTWLRWHFGFDFEGLYCTMLASNLVYAGNFRLSASLAGACHTFLGIILDKGEQIGFNMTQPLTKQQVMYAGLDAWIVLPLREQLNRNIKKFNLLETALIEMQAVPQISSIHSNGIILDKQKWIRIANQNKATVKRLTQELIEDSGSETLNPNSSQQLKAMFARNGVFVVNTGVDTLKELEHIPIVKKVLQYKKASKASSSFGMNVLEYVNPITNRIHSNIRQIGAKTGRLSANNINLMQIPHDKEVRSCFVAKEGCKFVVADYSQFELRIVAEASKEPLFIDAYQNNIDLHTQTTSLVFKLPFEQVPDEKRQIGKRVNFGTVYGIGAGSFSEKFGIEEDEAEKILREFFKIHATLSEWLKLQTYKVRELGYTTSASGRLINLKKAVEKGNSPHNLAKNFPIQSTNADVIKMVAYALGKVLPRYNAKFVNIVHDEIVLEVPDKFAPTMARQLKEIMIACAERYVRIVPVDVEVKISDVWEK